MGRFPPFKFAIVEKVFAKHYGGYLALEWGHTRTAMQAISGHTKDCQQLSIDDFYHEDLSHYLNKENCWVTVGNGHCWAVFAVGEPDEEFKKGWVDLWEPHNLVDYPRGGAEGLYDYRLRSGMPNTETYSPSLSGMFRLPWARFEQFTTTTCASGESGITVSSPNGNTTRRRRLSSLTRLCKESER